MDRQRFKALVHYICWRCANDPSQLGAVKLNKILWLSELNVFARLGSHMTGARYVKRQYGPVPPLILPVLRELEAEGVLSTQEADHFGKTKHEYKVFVPASGNFLPEKEKVIVDETIKFVCESHTAASISEATHDHVWRAALDGEEIPLYTVFAQAAPITDEDREWAAVQLENALK